jgi:Tfp pilus assembly pilus retraction ATPase PilT
MASDSQTISDTVTSQITKVQEGIQSSKNELKFSIEAKEENEAVLRSLFFPEYKVRQEQVKDVHEHTFRWIFDENSATLGKWDSFTKWLENEDGIYWIQGKAGSGKSTLMNFLLDDQNSEKIHKHLHIWAGHGKLVFISFFFWRAGISLQKSVLGLLRSMLYQILQADPSLTSSMS